MMHALLPWQVLDPDMAALVVHTSGSTGAPQAIPKRLSQMTAEVATLELLFGAAIGDADIIATVSHQHIYGLLFKVLWPLAAGRADPCRQPGLPGAAGRSPGPAPVRAGRQSRPPETLARASGLARRASHAARGILVGRPARARRRRGRQPPAGLHADRNLRQQRNRRGGLALRACRRRTARGKPCLASSGAAPRAWPCSKFAPRTWTTTTGCAWPTGSNTRARTASCCWGAPTVWSRSKKNAFRSTPSKGPCWPMGLAREARVALCHEVAGERQALAAFVVLTPEGRALLDAHGKSAMNRRLRASLAGVVEAVALPRRWRYLDQMPINAQGKTPQALLLSLLGDAAAPRPARPAHDAARTRQRRVLLSLTVLSQPVLSGRPLPGYPDFARRGAGRLGDFPCAPVLRAGAIILRDQRAQVPASDPARFPRVPGTGS
ncbi:hypothetical protein LP420_37120 [Massilia sp. B-10]|nr:hypothetical protein LP420_37120 [Massilia sp. B-10]